MVADGFTDAQLLNAFVARRDEVEFEVLVHRHGPMVWGVCSRLLRNRADAEDAFQATFLVLARKAASVSPPEMVGNFLYGVARTTALRARAATSKRRRRERQVDDVPEARAGERDLWDDLQLLLDQELSRLADKYRAAIVLCDLEGRTRPEAARQLGIPEGTLSSRLTTARRMLARRLSRHGLSASGGVLATLLAERAASACVPSPLTSAVVKAAASVAAGAASVAAPAQVISLTEGVLKAMLMTKLKTVTAFLVLAAAACYPLGVLTRTAAGQPEATEANSPPAARPRLQAKDDLAALQGIWQVVGIESGGKPKPNVQEAYFMVRGKRACWQTKDSNLEGGLYLDPASRPMAFDLATSVRTIEGLYAINGDTLRLCFQPGMQEADRPTQLSSTRAVLFTLQRKFKTAEMSLPDGTRVFPRVMEAPPESGPQPVPGVDPLVPPTAVAPPVPTYAPPPNRTKPAKEQSDAVGNHPPAKVGEIRVGDIIIIGNERTPQSLILKQVSLYPGQIMTLADLQVAEKNLAKLGRFVVDPAKGIRPTVSVVNPDTNEVFKGVLVNVKELPPRKLSKTEQRELQNLLDRLEQLLAVLDDKSRQQYAIEISGWLQWLRPLSPTVEGK
jgi:RNA polymerase sigma-70 factor (ECF subfamily)